MIPDGVESITIRNERCEISRCTSMIRPCYLSSTTSSYYAVVVESATPRNRCLYVQYLLVSVLLAM